jgi:predicted AAA+ superfamily ATPase
LGLSGNTIKQYLNFLESSFFVRVLHPFFANIGKRLVKSPKVYLTDSGLLHVLLGVRRQLDLTLHPMAGGSWEGYVLSQVIGALPEGLEPLFFRTSDGTECDLLLLEGIRPLACVEVKMGNVVKVAKGFHNTIETLETPLNFILTFDSDDYFIQKNIRVMGLIHFIRQLPDILIK